MKPLLLEYAIEHKFIEKKTYEYNYKKSLNIIKICEKEILFIDSNPSDPAYTTQTKVAKEQSDVELVPTELMTITEVAKENCENSTSNMYLDIKTFVERE